LAKKWEIQMSEQVSSWLEAQPRSTKVKVKKVLKLLIDHGPHLGRPLVDSIVGSEIRNLKELRVSSSNQLAIRILFCFTPARMALLLVAGDKSNNWSNWYSEAIEQAEEIYEQHLED
jgi:hypothetical protein